VYSEGNIYYYREKHLLQAMPTRTSGIGRLEAR